MSYYFRRWSVYKKPQGKLFIISFIFYLPGTDVSEKYNIFINIEISGIVKTYYPLVNEVAKGYSNPSVRPSFRNILVNTLRIKILQWILTKLGTYLVLKRICNPIDFQGHRSMVKVTGSNFYHVTSLWTLESISLNGFWLNLVHT